MELNAYFKSIVETSTCQIVICDLNHTIIYMNPKAILDYEKRGGNALIGKSIFDCHNLESRKKILEVIEWFKKDKMNIIVHTFYNEKKNKDVYMVALRDDDGSLIGYYEKHEFRDRDLSICYDI